MAFDGIITRAMATELADILTGGKIDKIYQPAKEALVFTIHTRNGNFHLFASASGADARVGLITAQPANPLNPPAFCMLLRKHLIGARIMSIRQIDYERIIVLELETLSELGFTITKKLTFEIMGKHSNIVLINTETGKIIDCIKRVTTEISRVRQVFPGQTYKLPPQQDKIGFDRATSDLLTSFHGDAKAMLAHIGGISPAVAEDLSLRDDPYAALQSLLEQIGTRTMQAHLYREKNGKLRDFHIASLLPLEMTCVRKNFPSLSICLDAFFEGRASTNRAMQGSHRLTRRLSAMIEKACLKKQRLEEDLLKAENSGYLRLYGELLTANLHRVSVGAKEVTVTSYYDGSEVTIPLDPRFSAPRNAQLYFKRYAKSRTAIKEKKVQLAETQSDIDYLESQMTYLENAIRPEEVAVIHEELVETGYMRRAKKNRPGSGRKRCFKSSPLRYTSPSGFEILAGRNNRENDELTLKIADKKDLWLHTKDIPGSHVIVRLHGKEPAEEDIRFAAQIAAHLSNAKDSANVPVDYVEARYVKKPSGAKPGMVIFTNNHTLYIDPLPADYAADAEKMKSDTET